MMPGPPPNKDMAIILGLVLMLPYSIP